MVSCTAVCARVFFFCCSRRLCGVSCVEHAAVLSPCCCCVLLLVPYMCFLFYFFFYFFGILGRFSIYLLIWYFGAVQYIPPFVCSPRSIYVLAISINFFQISLNLFFSFFFHFFCFFSCFLFFYLLFYFFFFF